MDKETDPSHAIRELEKTIANLEAQRSTLGDAAINTAIRSLRETQTQLAAAVQPYQQRKIATILFMDIVSSTQLTRDLDPEDKIAVLESALVRLSEPVNRHGGHIVRYQGDGFKAVFGLPTARENDPEHAVRVALEIQVVASEIAVEFEASHGLRPFQVRVGIDTGMVVAGGVTEGQDSLDGAAVVMSARLESAALPGDVLISHNTHRHVRGLFDVQEREPLLAKGFDRTVRVYRVLQAKPRPFYMAKREFEGIETHTIGREAELLGLQNAYMDVAEGHETRLITIVGDAGVGKSRLLYEFENWVLLLPDSTGYFKGRGAPENLHHSAGLWHDLFSSCFEIPDTDSAATMREKFLAGIGDRVAADSIPVIGQLIGFDFSHLPAVQAALKDPLFDQMAITYFANYFKTFAEEQLVLLLLEDIHWADDRSLDLLDRLLSALPDCRLLVICLTRPGLYERRPDWGSGQAYSSRLDLQPLSVRHSRILVDEILQRVKDPPQELREILAREAEGNPFYLEELVKMLLDQGVIQRDSQVDAPWQVELERLQGMKLPDTLAGVIQARLDGLPEAEKDVLRRASVIGRLFWDRAVDYLGESSKSQKSAASLAQVWPSLRTREMIFHRERSVFRNSEEYIFKHALLREAVYDSVLRRLRREYHKRAALWMILESTGRSGEFAGLIADHWSLAEEPAQEAEWQFQAGKWAAAHYAHTEALGRLQRALDLTAETETYKQFAILTERERIYDLLGKRDLQGEDLARLETFADKLDDPNLGAEVALRISAYNILIGNHPAAIAYAQQALEKSISTGNLAHEAEAYFAWGNGFLGESEITQARRKFEQAQELAHQGGYKQIEMDVYLRLSWLCHDFAPQRKTHLESGLQIAQQIGDRRKEAQFLFNIGRVIFDQGRPAETKDYFVKAIRILHDIGARSDEALYMLDFGYVAQALGETPGLREYQHQARQILSEIGDHHREITVIHKMGEEALFNGDLEEARMHFTQAQSLAQEIGNNLSEAGTFLQIGTSYLFQHQYQKCLEMARENLPRYRQQENRWGECAVHLETGWALAGLGVYNQAAEACQAALKIAEQAEITILICCVLPLISWIARKKKDFPLAIEYANQAIDKSHQWNEIFPLIMMHNQLGYALLEAHHLEQAIQAFHDGIQVCQNAQWPAGVLGNQAGVAKALLEQHKTADAMQWVEEILAYLQAGNLDRTIEPMHIYLICIQVLQAAQDPRARLILHRAYAELLDTASKFDEPFRKFFLENVAENRAILELGESE
ncbi:MAG: AAA family ATPase [Anaerolineales bacterium]|jgi:class 3 adenylate cyclase/tetratricopeptide (TPR) repeat protein|nr:AAA family ATPase [Anaerolineales bacterium]